MARRRTFKNLLKRSVGWITKKRKPRPTTPLKRRAADNILSKLALADKDTVYTNINEMNDNELRWTANASEEDLRNKALNDADRTFSIDGRILPLNPWWYHGSVKWL